MLHIKLKGTMQAHILSLHTASTHVDVSEGQILFSECGHVRTKLKGKKYRPTLKQKLSPYG